MRAPLVQVFTIMKNAHHVAGYTTSTLAQNVSLNPPTTCRPGPPCRPHWFTATKTPSSSTHGPPTTRLTLWPTGSRRRGVGCRVSILPMATATIGWVWPDWLRFPGVKGLATSEVLARVEFEAGPGMAGYWEGIFLGEVPTGTDKVLPELLTTDTMDLEGNEIRVIRIGRADTAESTILHIPSLAAVVTGDLAYNEVHMMTADTGRAGLRYESGPAEACA